MDFITLAIRVYLFCVLIFIGFIAISGIYAGYCDFKKQLEQEE